MDYPCCVVVHIVCIVNLDQACTTNGPETKCGQRKLLIWPLKLKILLFLLLSFIKNTLWCVKAYQFWPLDMSKKIWPAMRFELYTPDLDRQAELNLTCSFPLRLEPIFETALPSISSTFYVRIFCTYVVYSAAVFYVRMYVRKKADECLFGSFESNFKSGHKWPRNKQLASFTKIKSKSLLLVYLVDKDKLRLSIS